jgi:GAF domain-containing protein
MLVQGQSVGVLGVYDDPQHPLSAPDLELIESVARQVAQALEGARLSAMTQNALDEARTLYRFGELVSAETDVQEVSRAVSQSLIEDLGYTTAYIGIADEENERLDLVAGAGPVGETFRQSVAVSDTQDVGAMAFRRREAIVINDLPDDSRKPEGSQVEQLVGRIGFVPIVSEQKVLGVIGVARSFESPEIGERDVRMLEAVAVQTAGAIQRAELLDQTQQALDAADAATRRYLRDSWDAFLEGRTVAHEAYVASPEGMVAAEAEELWFPEMAHALETGETVSLLAGAEDGAGVPRSALAVPLKTRGQVIGVVDVYREGSSQGWSEREQELIQDLVGQIGDGIESERQFAQTQLTLAETERMYDASQRISAAQDQREIIQVVLDIATSMGADQVAVFGFEHPVTEGRPDSQELLAFWDRDETVSPASLGTRYSTNEYPLLRFISRDKGLVVPDVETDDRLHFSVRNELVRSGFRALAAMPIAVGNEWLGYSLLLMRTTRRFTPGDLRVYESVNDQAATALRSAQLYRDAQRRARREELIREITSKMRGTPDLDTILNTAVQELGKALGVSRAFVRLSTGATPQDEPAGNGHSGEH